MDLLTKFTATVTPAIEDIDDNVIEGYTPGTSKHIRCVVCEANATAVFERFGIEDKAGAILYTTLDYGALINQGDTVDYLGNRYTVSSPITRKVADLSTDHALCFLEHIR